MPATDRGQPTVALVRYVNADTCLIEVHLEGQLVAEETGPDLFVALVAARRTLESREVLLTCNGCRRNVYPSAMLGQATNGRRAYVLTLPRGAARLTAVDIFEPAPDPSEAVTVDEQRAWFDYWRQTPYVGEVPE